MWGACGQQRTPLGRLPTLRLAAHKGSGARETGHLQGGWGCCSRQRQSLGYERGRQGRRRALYQGARLWTPADALLAVDITLRSAVTSSSPRRWHCLQERQGRPGTEIRAVARRRSVPSHRRVRKLWSFVEVLSRTQNTAPISRGPFSELRGGGGRAWCEENRM